MSPSGERESQQTESAALAEAAEDQLLEEQVQRRIVWEKSDPTKSKRKKRKLVAPEKRQDEAYERLEEMRQVPAIAWRVRRAVSRFGNYLPIKSLRKGWLETHQENRAVTDTLKFVDLKTIRNELALRNAIDRLVNRTEHGKSLDEIFTQKRADDLRAFGQFLLAVGVLDVVNLDSAFTLSSDLGSRPAKKRSRDIGRIKDELIGEYNDPHDTSFKDYINRQKRFFKQVFGGKEAGETGPTGESSDSSGEEQSSSPSTAGSSANQTEDGSLMDEEQGGVELLDSATLDQVKNKLIKLIPELETAFVNADKKHRSARLFVERAIRNDSRIVMVNEVGYLAKLLKASVNNPELLQLVIAYANKFLLK